MKQIFYRLEWLPNQLYQYQIIMIYQYTYEIIYSSFIKIDSKG